MILSLFSSQGWESWDVVHRPLIPERMPVLIDDDLRLEDGPAAPRPTVAVNRWLRELPASGAPAPSSWGNYARVVKEWAEFLAEHGVGLFDSRERLKAGLSRYAEHRAAGPIKARFAATTWGQHMSILSLFYRWAMAEGYAPAEPFTYRSARALFAGTGREVRVNLAVRRTPKPHVTIKYLEPDFTELFVRGLRGRPPRPWRVCSATGSCSCPTPARPPAPCWWCSAPTSRASTPRQRRPPPPRRPLCPPRPPPRPPSRATSTPAPADPGPVSPRPARVGSITGSGGNIPNRVGSGPSVPRMDVQPSGPVAGGLESEGWRLAPTPPTRHPGTCQRSAAVQAVAA
jgi:hypothetical protein